MNLKNLYVLVRNVKIQSYTKGDIIIPFQSQEKEIYFVRKGIVRVYHNHENGNNITFQIYAERQVFSNIHSILLDKPSNFEYEAIEDTKVFVILYEHFTKLSSKNEELLEMSRTFFGKRIISRAFERVESFVFLSPEERYKKYLKDHPNIINRVPDMYIANILGITAVSLSRIRKRIASKK